jgi:hypothetical protein
MKDESIGKLEGQGLAFMVCGAAHLSALYRNDEVPWWSYVLAIALGLALIVGAEVARRRASR